MFKILDIIFPPCCISCGENVNESGTICHKCWGEINFISDPQCNICGFPFDFEISNNPICAACAKEKPHFSKARAVFLYDDSSKKMVTSFKYTDRIENRKAYAKWMARIGENLIADADFLIPVPIHLRKLISRKYNQAGLLAQEISKISGKKTVTNALIRKKHTIKQASLNRRIRFQNISGAFNVNDKFSTILEGKRILLIDDVITTGATADECAKILKKARVANVDVLTLAKTIY